MAADVLHPNVERDARAQRWFLKDHPQCFARQYGPVATALPFQFQLLGQPNQVSQVFGRPVPKIKKVFHVFLFYSNVDSAHIRYCLSAEYSIVEVWAK